MQHNNRQEPKAHPTKEPTKNKIFFYKDFILGRLKRVEGDNLKSFPEDLLISTPD